MAKKWCRFYILDYNSVTLAQGSRQYDSEAELLSEAHELDEQHLCGIYFKIPEEVNPITLAHFSLQESFMFLEPIGIW